MAGILGVGLSLILGRVSSGWDRPCLWTLPDPWRWFSSLDDPLNSVARRGGMIRAVTPRLIRSQVNGGVFRPTKYIGSMSGAPARSAKPIGRMWASQRSHCSCPTSGPSDAILSALFSSAGRHGLARASTGIYRPTWIQRPNIASVTLESWAFMHPAMRRHGSETPACKWAGFTFDHPRPLTPLAASALLSSSTVTS